MYSDDELIRLIEASKSKIWEDKKRLGLKKCEQVGYRSSHPTDSLNVESHKFELSQPTTGRYVGFENQRHGMKKSSASLPSDVRDIKKEELIQKLSSSPWLLELGENQHIKNKSSARPPSPLPCDVREIEKDEFINCLVSPSGLALLDEHKEKKSLNSRPVSPLPEDVRENKKNDLISKLTSVDGFAYLGEQKKSPNSRPVSPLPEDVRQNKKNDLISKLTSVDGFAYLGEQKKSLHSGFVSPLPDDVREKRKEELILKLTSTEGLVNLGEQKEHLKKSPRSELLSSLPDDVREIKKDIFISNLTSEEGLVHFGEQKEEKLLQSITPVQDHEKDELISNSVQGLVEEKETWNKEIDSMVRFGEYSPQNPGLLSPGKALLGLGEYEEKRRQILERKKREYLEQMAQARQNVKDIRQQQDSSEFVMKRFVNDAGTQTDLKITGYVEGEGGLSPMAMSTQTPGGEVPVLPSMSSFSNFTTISTQTSGGNIKLSTSVPVVNNDHIGFVNSAQSLPAYHPLSPRERKMAEFRETYSPSFLQGMSLHQGGFAMSSEPDMRGRREAYQEELRKQIEEKRRIDAEEQERERRKEAAIARRAELQRERMRQEYIKEESLRKERQLQRMQQVEEFQRRQVALKLEEELEREAEARRKLEKRLEDLEAGLAHHTTYTTQELGVSLPVPALRSKLNKEELLENQIPVEVNSNVKKCDSEEHNVSAEGGNIIAERNILSRERTKYSPNFNDTSYFVHGSHSDMNLGKYSAFKESTEPVKFSYHRPPSEILNAAGCSESAPHILDENRNLSSESNTRHLRTYSNESSLQPIQKSNVDNGLSIPILRAPSPVIPAVCLGQPVSGSSAMRKVEAKWQVPAVEKSVINVGSNPNTILTQLGAVRHQLQLEQMRMEQHLQNKLKHKSC